GAYGVIASAAPPSATQAPPKIPRATARHPAGEQALRKPAGGEQQDHAGTRRKRAQQADRALRKAEPFDQKRPLPGQRLRQPPLGAETRAPARNDRRAEQQ